MNVDHIACILKTGLLEYVDQSDYFDLIEHTDIIERTYKRGQTIFFEGDTVKRICIISEGSVRSEKTYSNGVIHLLTVFEPNTIFGLEIALSQRKSSPVDFIANEPTTVLFLSVESLDKHKYRKPIKKVLTEMMADENIRMMHKIEILAERGLRERVIVYLNILARRFKSNTVPVKMSREQLASYLCVNRSALSNELSKMKQDGIIDFTRHEFRLLSYNEDGTPK